MMQQVVTQQPEQPQGRTVDHWRLLDTVYHVQEVEKPYEPEPYRGIADAELMYRLQWTRVKYEAVRDQLLGEPDQVLIHTPSGGLALTW